MVVSPFPSILNWLFGVPGKIGPRFDGGLLGRAMITGIRSFLDPEAVSRSLSKTSCQFKTTTTPMQSMIHMSNEKKAPGCLGYIGDEIPPSYLGITIP